MEVVKGLLGSKKFVVTMIGVIVSIAIHLGLDPEVAKELVPDVVKIVVGFVVGQGIADFGKERAKIEANGVVAVSKPAPG